jgi:hypothetical protein
LSASEIRVDPGYEATACPASPERVCSLQQARRFVRRRRTAACDALKRHETQGESPLGWGIRWMSEIIAKIMLFAAYTSILGSTLGWFGHAHMAIR